MIRHTGALLTILIIGLQFSAINSAKILNLMNVASPSHHVFNRILSRALVDRGHQVTVISPDAEEEPIPQNMTYIKMDGVYETLKEAYQYEEFAHESPLGMIFTLFKWVSVSCEAGMKSAGAHKLLKLAETEKFDLIITEAGWGECFYGFIPVFGSPPVIAVSAFGIPSWTTISMGTPTNPSYVPNYLLPFSSNMTFFERVQNFLIFNILDTYYEYRHLSHQEAIFKKYYKGNIDMSFWEIQRNFTLFLGNIVPVLEDARPLSPNMIPIGGMHIIDKPKALPQDLKKFLDESKHGFIFFSVGSNMRSDELPIEKRQALLEAFGELKPVRVLWKFESDELPGQPSNVMIGKWLPQSDILAHPNILMFISHCGKLSSTEAVYRGVPVVGMPLFVDQILNFQKLNFKGVAVELDYKTLTKQSVLKAVRSIIDNKSYRTNMKKMSALFKDQPETSLERALFWIEYIIRHGEASHLKPPLFHLSLYQYLLLDVILFLFVVVFICLWISYIILKIFYRLLFGTSTMKVKSN